MYLMKANCFDIGLLIQTQKGVSSLSLSPFSLCALFFTDTLTPPVTYIVHRPYSFSKYTSFFHSWDCGAVGECNNCASIVSCQILNFVPLSFGDNPVMLWRNTRWETAARGRFQLSPAPVVVTEPIICSYTQRCVLDQSTRCSHTSHYFNLLAGSSYLEPTTGTRKQW